MFTRICPRCSGSMLGAEIEAQGLDPRTQPPIYNYIVSALCPGCGARHGDFVLARDGDKGMADWREKVARYKTATHLTENMLRDEVEVGTMFQKTGLCRNALPSIKVTREEFIKLMMEDGSPREKAEFQANIAEGLGGELRIGDQYVSIKKDA